MIALAFLFGMIIGTDATLREACTHVPAAQHAQYKCPPK